MSKKEMVLTYYMKDILESHPVVNLKKILKNMKQDIGAYSKMKKADLVNRILELKKKGYPVPKVEMYKKPERKKNAPVQGPRNLMKGFGIKRTEKKPESMNTQKKKFFEHYKFKIGNEVVIPDRGFSVWKILSIEPKFLNIQSLNRVHHTAPDTLKKEGLEKSEKVIKKRMYYTVANKLIGKYYEGNSSWNGKPKYPYLAG